MEKSLHRNCSCCNGSHGTGARCDISSFSNLPSSRRVFKRLNRVVSNALQRLYPHRRREREHLEEGDTEVSNAPQPATLPPTATSSAGPPALPAPDSSPPAAASAALPVVAESTGMAPSELIPIWRDLFDSPPVTPRPALAAAPIEAGAEASQAPDAAPAAEVQVPDEEEKESGDSALLALLATAARRMESL
ncbi:hypothetical protein PInf_018526 [Phytophthora infestans]|nr:hypothetical protein PInf_018526 [Phytophthora infestans]